MRVACTLRNRRGDVSLRVMAARAGLNRGTLSRLERGVQLPTRDEERRLAGAYGGTVDDWYPGIVRAVALVEEPAS